MDIINHRKMVDEYARQLDENLEAYLKGRGMSRTTAIHPLSIKDEELYATVDFLKLQLVSLFASLSWNTLAVRATQAQTRQMNESYWAIYEQLEPLIVKHQEDTFC